MILLAHKHALFCLDSLVQALGVTTALHNAAGKLVDDLNLAVLHDVLFIAMEHVLGLERLLQVVDQLAGQVGVDVLDAQALLDLLQAALGSRDGVLGLVHHVIAGLLLGLDGGKHIVLDLLAALQAAHGTGEVLVGARRLGASARDDEGRTRLIDKDGVDLVDDGVSVTALHTLTGAHHHVVTQIVEAELGIGAIGDVGGIGGQLVLERHAVLQQAHGHTQEAIDLAHPLGVALCQVVVNGNDVDALGGNGVKVAGERGDKRFTLARLHLGDHAFMQRHGADELHIEMTHAKRALGSLANGGECLGQQRVKRLARLVTLAKLSRLACQLLVGHLDEIRLEAVDFFNDLLVALNVLVGAKREQLRHETHRRCPLLNRAK